MRRYIFLTIVLAVLMTGCSDNSVNSVLELRQQIQNSRGYEFDASITADYADELYEFDMHCWDDNSGKLYFEVLSPESIAGICGYIEGEGGYLTFEDKVLAFPLMADQQLSPVSAPWVFMKALRGGYIRAAGSVDGDMKVIINDTYEEDALQVDVWINTNNLPHFAEILWGGRRILSVEVASFQFL